MKINERWEELKEESNRNIQSERGIVKGQIRSIQTEGHFGDIKENENFRRFHYRTSEKVYKEFMMYAIGRNINKYHRFLNYEIEKYEGKRNRSQPREGSTSENQNKGFLRPKINRNQKKRYPCSRSRLRKSLDSTRVSLFLYQGLKISINRHPHKIKYPDGYESWSPKEAFETAYRELECEDIDFICKEMKCIRIGHRKN